MFIHESISELLDTCLPHRNFEKFTQGLEGSQKSIDQNDEVRNKGVVHYEEKMKEDVNVKALFSVRCRDEKSYTTERTTATKRTIY